MRGFEETLYKAYEQNPQNIQELAEKAREMSKNKEDVSTFPNNIRKLVKMVKMKVVLQFTIHAP